MIEEHKIQVIRSLLQKAVRRGNTELVEILFDYLVHNGELSWLRKRFVVIVFEECWPLGFEITDKSSPRKIKEMLLRVTQSEKYKGASALAAIAGRYAEGYGQKLYGTKEENELIKSVGNFIKDSEAYWTKLKEAAKEKGLEHLVLTAKELSKSALFPVDKAMFYSAALLALITGIPKVAMNNKTTPKEDFPYWMAIDKHTALGRLEIEEFAKSHEDYKTNKDLSFYISTYQFYFEGAEVDNLADERLWKLNVISDLIRINKEPEKALKEWLKYKPVLIKHLEKYANEIKDELNKPKDKEPDLFG